VHLLGRLGQVLLVLLCAGQVAKAELPIEVRLQTLGPDTANFPGLLTYEEGQLQGHFPKLFQCVGEDLKIRFTFTGMPFVRAQRNVEAGDVHGFFPANLTARRDQFAEPSAALTADYKVLLSRPDFQPSNPQQLLSYVGVMRGAHYEQALAESLNHPIAVVDSYEQLARMLQTARIGALVASEMFIDATLSTQADTPPLTRKRLEQAPMHAYFSKAFLGRYPAFLPAFNQALNECREPLAGESLFSTPY
jgi:polar amino acid transport system substrate-binding protein